MDEERRSMKKNKAYADRLYHVADAQFGIPTACPCGGRIQCEVAENEALDQQPGKRYFMCKEYKPDGMHFKQPWVLGVEEEFRKLSMRLDESAQLKWRVQDLIREVQTLKAEVDRLTLRVQDLEMVL